MSDARKWYDERISNGICVACGAKLPEDDTHRHCPECRKKYKEKNKGKENVIHHYDANKKLDEDAKAAFDLGMNYREIQVDALSKTTKGGKMSVLISAIECFGAAVFWGLLPFGIGFALGWIMKGEKNGK